MKCSLLPHPQHPAQLLSHPCSSHPDLTNPAGTAQAGGRERGDRDREAQRQQPLPDPGMGTGWELPLHPNPTPSHPATPSTSAVAWLGLGNIFIQGLQHWDHRLSLSWSWEEQLGMLELDQKENQQENPHIQVPGTPLPLEWSQPDPQHHPRPVRPAAKTLLGKKVTKPSQKKKGFLPNLGQSLHTRAHGNALRGADSPKKSQFSPKLLCGWERGPGAAAPCSPIHSQPAAFPGIPISSGVRGWCPCGHGDAPVWDNSIPAHPAVPHSMDSLPPSPPGWEMKSSCHGK